MAIENSLKTALNDGKEFERIVASIHRQFAKDAAVTENEKIIGKSGRERQVDVAIRTAVMGYKVFILIECKDYNKKIGIGKVDELIGKMDDIGADKAILVSNSGFTKDALERSRKDNRVELSTVVDIKNQKLRAKLAIPFLAHFDFPSTLQFQVTGTGDISFTWDLLELEKKKFRNLWNQGTLNSQPGEHSYDDVIRDDERGRLVVTMLYSVERTSRFKMVPLEESVGIYNYGDGEYTTKEMVTVPVNMDDVRKWEVVTGELPKAPMQMFAKEEFAEFDEIEN